MRTRRERKAPGEQGPPNQQSKVCVDSERKHQAQALDQDVCIYFIPFSSVSL